MLLFLQLVFVYVHLHGRCVAENLSLSLHALDDATFTRTRISGGQGSVRTHLPADLGSERREYCSRSVLFTHIMLMRYIANVINLLFQQECSCAT